MERIESMEKLLLCRLFSSEELNVVDKQNVNITILVTEAFSPVVTDRIDKFIREFLRRDVNYLVIWVMFQDIVPNCVHQMGFAQTYSTV
ncbi:hypothetical protein D3C75_775590 [compost metagenome]